MPVNIQKNKKTANAERIRERNIAREHMIENGMAERVKDLPDDDEWIRDDEWDKIYKQGVIKDE